MTRSERADGDGLDDDGGDEGVLEPADSLLDDDLSGDVLDTGVDAGTGYRGATAYGTTPAEEARGESLDQLLAEEEPDPGEDAAWTDEDEPSDDDEVPYARSGRLVAPDEGTRGDDEADAVAADVGVDGGGAGAEEAAVHLTPPPPYR